METSYTYYLATPGAVSYGEEIVRGISEKKLKGDIPFLRKLNRNGEIQVKNLKKEFRTQNFVGVFYGTTVRHKETTLILTGKEQYLLEREFPAINDMDTTGNSYFKILREEPISSLREYGERFKDKHLFEYGEARAKYIKYILEDYGNVLIVADPMELLAIGLYLTDDPFNRELCENTILSSGEGIILKDPDGANFSRVIYSILNSTRLTIPITSGV